jgi:gamma-butyrobetaine dioxygenase
VALERGQDLEHEIAGANALAALFPPEVTEPIRLHVAAKRYLVATDPGYAARLSAASVASLACQGGPFGAAAAEEFAAGRFAPDALALRRWDEGAKDPLAETPDLAHFRHYLRAVARGAG